ALPEVFLRFQTLGYLWLSYTDNGGGAVAQPIFTPQQMENVYYMDDVLGGSDQGPFTEAGGPSIPLSRSNTHYLPEPPEWSFPYDQPEDTLQLMNAFASGSSGKSASLALALALAGTLTTWMLSQPEVLGMASTGAGPLAAIGSLEPLRVGTSLAFDASAAFDPPGDGLLSYAWNFGDGGSAMGELVRHTYVAVGRYTVELTVSAPSGVRQVRRTLTIASEPATYFNRYSLREHSGAPPRNPTVKLPVPHDTSAPASSAKAGGARRS